MNHIDLLQSLGACDEGVDYARQHPTLRAAWDACERGDHMLWLAARLGVDRRAEVWAACQCARLALVHVPAGETRPLRAIETAEAWCLGGATIEEVSAAADAADAAAVAYAAEAAVLAGCAAAAYATAAADAAAYAAYAADADVAVYDHASTLRDCAVIVRATLPWELIEDAITVRGA